MLLCRKISFVAIYAVLPQNLFCSDMRSFYVERNVVRGEKKTNIMYHGYYSGSPDSLLPASTPSIISPAQSYRWDIEYCKDNVCNSGILQRSFQLWDIECYTDNVSYCVIFCDSVLQSYRWDIIEYFKDNVSNCGIFFCDSTLQSYRWDIIEYC